MSRQPSLASPGGGRRGKPARLGGGASQPGLGGGASQSRRGVQARSRRRGKPGFKSGLV